MTTIVKFHEVKTSPFHKNYYKPLESEKIVINSAKCKSCAKILTSINANEFHTCICGKLAIKGGYEFIWHQYRNKESYINRSIIKIES